ncbi:GvpL/GvpF family gas vesicle protein [Gracilibacillus massiliensis]|uniref:GvpL/GvpF family gas vesicle protein n=1 Tax=Gracilibacillus massiliensis TaxID=1564956 RepID=UPI00071DBECE|nr:GvpL/GvpF family gas vesicle protein [Gracilibacillus massiliensis]
MEQLIYLYGFIPENESKEKPLPKINGFDDKESIYTIPVGSMEAVVCGLNESEFSEQVLQEKTENDMDWLQQKALHHHQTIMDLNDTYTLIPLQFCTIYKNEERLYQTIETKKEKMKNTLENLKEKEEWNLKIYCADQQLKADISQHSSTIEAKKQEINHLSPGRRFFEMKKMDSLMEEELEKEKHQICKEVHEQMNQFALESIIKKNWNKEMTGRKENMCWNSVYFLERPMVESLKDKLVQIEKSVDKRGFTLELSGPWPAYHFSDLK